MKTLLLIMTLTATQALFAKTITARYDHLRDASLGKGPVSVNKMVGFWETAGSVHSSKCSGGRETSLVDVEILSNGTIMKIEKTTAGNFVITESMRSARRPLSVNQFGLGFQSRNINLGPIVIENELYIVERGDSMIDRCAGLTLYRKI